MLVFEWRLVARPEFLHNVIGGLHGGSVDVAVVYQHAFAIVVFGAAQERTHGGLVVLLAESGFAKRRAKAQAAERGDELFGLGALSLADACG